MALLKSQINKYDIYKLYIYLVFYCLLGGIRALRKVNGLNIG